MTTGMTSGWDEEKHGRKSMYGRCWCFSGFKRYHYLFNGW